MKNNPTILRRAGKLRLIAMLSLPLGLAIITLLMPARAGTPMPDVGEPAGTITTFAGGPGQGPATSFGQDPLYLAAEGDRVYLSDVTNQVIRMLRTSSGKETVVAGNLTPGFSGDGGPAVKAQLFNSGVAVDSTGNVYIADFGDLGSLEGNCRVRKVDTAGVITTVAGTGTPGYSGDGGPATQAQLNFPRDVAVDPVGNLYIADTSNNVIRKVDTSGIISTLVALPARNQPNGVTVDGSGNVFITVRLPSQVFKFDTAGVLSPFAGDGTLGFGGDGGPATEAALNEPTGVVVDRAGNLFIADNQNLRLRKVDPSGIITTVAGTGHPESGPDGGPPADQLKLASSKV